MNSIINIKKIFLSAHHVLLILSALLFAGANAVSANVEPDLQKQRLEMLQAGDEGIAGIPALVKGLKSPSVLIRRAAVRSLGKIGVPAKEVLSEVVISDNDPLTKHIALYELEQIGGDILTILERVLDDPSEEVRISGVQVLTHQPRTIQTIRLLKKAQKDSSNRVARVASMALWPFHRESLSLREKPAFADHELEVVKKIPLPKEEWKFETDMRQAGHEKGWFDTDFDDHNWKNIDIEKVWGPQIGNEYHGVAWYRRKFILPEKPVQDGTDIVFEGVDESAWVWINGKYIGQHDVGPDGWNKTFAIDVSGVLKWGEENQITVRVFNTDFAGGIWKPVYLETLKQ